MEYNYLSTTNIKVSKACLGTMSFGAHVSENESFNIMDKALELGINFFDTAEIYSVPPSKDTFGITENIIGKWIKSRNARNNIVLASKITGPARPGFVDYIRGGDTNFSKDSIEKAIDGSLKRLNTDFIDLYQLHWPDRNLNTFGQRHFIPYDEEIMRPIEEILNSLQYFIKKGKIRKIGLSNESPWGTMKFLQKSKELNLPRMVSVQNSYSLLTRTFDTCLSEISLKENIGLLAYSPLGYGVLGGRYIDGNKPEGGRFTKYPRYNLRYQSSMVNELIKKYDALAKENSLKLSELALTFVYSKPFLTSCIIGPSNVDQLIENVNALNITLSKDVFKGIEKINEICPNVCA